jgi:hypothetical protein
VFTCSFAFLGPVSDPVALAGDVVAVPLELAQGLLLGKVHQVVDPPDLLDTGGSDATPERHLEEALPLVSQRKLLQRRLPTTW